MLDVLEDLILTQRQVNVALEMTPQSPAKSTFLLRRKALREYFDGDIRSKWARLARLEHIDPQLEKGLAYLHGLNSTPARILGKTISDAAFDCLTREKTLLKNINSVNVRKQGLAGFMDYFSSSSSVPDEQRGRTALENYYNQAKSYSSNNLPVSLSEFLAMPKIVQSDLISGLGATINSIDQDIGYTDDQVKVVMEKIADTGQGLFPQNIGIFQQAIGKDASDPSFWSAIKFTAVETASQVATGAAQGLQEIGNFSLGLLKNWKLLLIGGVAIGVFVYSAPLRKLVSRGSK